MTGVLFNTNLSDTATVNLYGNSSSDFTTPNYSTTMDVYEGRIVKFLDEDYQYWRIEITDISVTQIELKYGFIGEYTQMPPMDPNINLEYSTTSKVTFSQSGQTYGDKGYEVFSTSFTFPTITDYPREIDEQTIATRDEILLMWRFVEGITPIYIVIWENSMDKVPPILGIIDEDSMTFEKEGVDTWSVSFGFRETR